MNPKMEHLLLSVFLANKNKLTGWKPLDISKIVMLKLSICPNTSKTKLMMSKKKNKKKLMKLNLIAKKQLFNKKMNIKLNIKKMKTLKMNLEKFPLN